MSLEREDLKWDDLRGILQEGGAAEDDLDRFDTIVSRRKLLGLLGAGGALAALTELGVGKTAAVNGMFRRGLIPVAWAQETQERSEIPGKPGMTVHSDRPVNGEFAPHLLDDDVTPSERHFVRNNGIVPDRARNQDPQGWKMTVDGEVDRTIELTLDDLKGMPAVSMPLLIECGGNGRGLFEPGVRGNPWRRGAVGCSEWTGVRLRDVLARAGLKSSAVYTAHYGEDSPIGAAQPFSRGVPIEKAIEEHTIIAYGMNGSDLTALNGYPVRLVVPGWIGSCSQKWLTRIWVRDRVHDSDKMGGYSYRLPAYPVAPGTRPPESDMVIAKSWIIKSLITQPAADARFRIGDTIQVRGHAWAGDGEVERVLVSTDYGITWKETELTPPPNRYAWFGWRTVVSLGGRGYYEIWARAFDSNGDAQPFRQPWNPRGYLGNVIHRVPVLVDV